MLRNSVRIEKMKIEKDKILGERRMGDCNSDWRLEGVVRICKLFNGDSCERMRICLQKRIQPLFFVKFMLKSV